MLLGNIIKLHRNVTIGSIVLFGKGIGKCSPVSKVILLVDAQQSSEAGFSFHPMKSSSSATKQ